MWCKGKIATWFSSYLHGRTQFVQIKATNSSGKVRIFNSEYLPASSGVIQAWVLEINLFSLYINDIVQLLSNVYMTSYADNISILVDGTNFDVNNLLSALLDWFNSDKLSPNMEESKYMVLHTRQKSIDDGSFWLGGQQFTVCNEIKFLGDNIRKNVFVPLSASPDIQTIYIILKFSQDCNITSCCGEVLRVQEASL
ncbi:hypothetical protein Trydic_g3334 [Trypoxylus dichotomus]